MTSESYLQFRRSQNRCLLCGQTMPEGARHPSILRLNPREEAIREDFCPPCWEQMDQREYFSFWITRRLQETTAVERKLARAERNEALWALFDALYSRQSDDLAPQLFLLAHLLMKYRVLTYVGPTPDGRLQFFHGPSQETFSIADLPLDAVSFVDVKNQIDSQVLDYAPSKDDGPAD